MERISCRITAPSSHSIRESLPRYLTTSTRNHIAMQVTLPLSNSTNSCRMETQERSRKLYAQQYRDWPKSTLRCCSS